MKVIYIHQYFRTPTMAGGTRSYEFAKRLVRRGHTVHMITSDQDGKGPPGRWRRSIEEGIDVHWLANPYSNSMSYRMRIDAFARFAIACSRRAASLDQDVVIASSTPLTVAVPGIYSARRRGAPMVFEVRDVWPEVPVALGALSNPILRHCAVSLETLAYRAATEVVALSPDMANSIRRRHPHVSVTVIPNSCDVDTFGTVNEPATRRILQRHPWWADGPTIVYAGTLGRANGTRYIVEMAAAIRETHPTIRFAILGRGLEEDLVRSVAIERGVLNQSLFLLGEVPKIEVPAYLASASLAMSTVIDVPALHANSANKVFDAFAAGLPVGINHEGWLADLIRTTDAGLVLPANNPTRAGFLVGEFVSDPERVAKARAACEQLARDDFSRDLLFDRFERVLMRAAEG